MSSYQYRNLPYNNKTVSRLSYLYNGCPYTWKYVFILKMGPTYTYLAWLIEWSHVKTSQTESTCFCQRVNKKIIILASDNMSWHMHSIQLQLQLQNLLLKKYTDIYSTIMRLKPMRVYLPHYFMDYHYIANILTSVDRAG